MNRSMLEVTVERFLLGWGCCLGGLRISSSLSDSLSVLLLLQELRLVERGLCLWLAVRTFRIGVLGAPAADAGVGSSCVAVTVDVGAATTVDAAVVSVTGVVFSLVLTSTVTRGWAPSCFKASSSSVRLDIFDSCSLTVFLRVFSSMRIFVVRLIMCVMAAVSSVGGWKASSRLSDLLLSTIDTII